MTKFNKFMTIIDNKQSNVINILRFPLMVAVVFIHADLLNFRYGNGPIPETIQIFPYVFNIISGGICRVAVPLFFMISGYLFYRDNSGVGLNYKEKFKHRLYTLLLPYLLWNTLFLALFAVGQSVFPNLLSGNNLLVSEYSLLNYFQVYWNIIGGLFPIDGPLWFLRDLIIVSALAPVLYLFIKYTRGVVIILLLVLWLLNIGTVGTFGVIRIDGFLFFSIGAWMSINKKPLAYSANKVKLILLSTIFVLCIILNLQNSSFIKGIVLSGIFLIPSLILYLQDKCNIKIPKRISATNFFIYAYHGLLITLLGKLITKGLNFQYDWQFIILYFVLAIFIVVIGIYLYRLLEKTIPSILYIFIGKRNK